MGQPSGPFDNVFAAPSKKQQSIIQSSQIDKDRASNVIAVSYAPIKQDDINKVGLHFQ